MKGIWHIIKSLAVLLVALSGSSCQFRDLERDSAELQVSVYIPDAILTKAETGLVDPLEAEKTISSLQIWVFLHEDVGTHTAGELVGYKSFSSADLANTGLPHATTTRFAMPLADEMFTILTSATGGSRPTVDVYAVANAASATSDGSPVSLSDATTRAQLDAVVLSGDSSSDNFGTGTLTQAVPTAGLPMSGVIKDRPVTGDYPVLNISTVTLSRAVSKLRFVFSQQKSANGDAPANTNCKIVSITLGGDIAGREYLFAETVPSLDGHSPLGYTFSGSGSDPLIANSAIGYCEDPSVYGYSSFTGSTAQEYETLIETAVANHYLTEYGLTYFRETDTQLSGSITYSTGGQNQTKTFTMSAPGDFARNHSWIIYAYFGTGGLYIRPLVLPWEDVDVYQFGTDGTVSMALAETYSEFLSPAAGADNEWYYRRLENGQSDWIQSQIVVSSTINAEGAPILSPRINIVCNKRNALRLQSDNDAFQFIEYTSASGGGYSAPLDYIEIPSGQQNISFYVVPTGDFNSSLTSPKAAISLVTVPSPGEASIKIPYNTSIFPGALDNTDVYFYYVAPSTIRDYRTTLPSDIIIQH